MVGSHIHALDFDAVHDVDIVLIVEKLDERIYLQLLSYLSGLAKELSHERFYTFLELRGGPIKPDLPPTGHCHIQLHVSAYGRADWHQVTGYPGCAEWVDYNQPIGGAELSRLCPCKPLTVEAIVRDIEVLQCNIQKRVAYSRVYSVQNGRLKTQMQEVPLSKDQYGQLLVSSPILVDRNAKKAFKILGRESDVIRTEPAALFHQIGVLRARIKRGDHSAIDDAVSKFEQIHQFVAEAKNQIISMIHKQ